jgi:DNA-binding CsgD family transcriptional regulator
MTERITNIDRPVPERDPGPRRRLDGQAMRERDQRIAELLAAHVPFRTIAARLGISLGSVQKAVARLRGAGTERETRITRTPSHRSRFDRASDDAW